MVNETELFYLVMLILLTLMVHPFLQRQSAAGRETHR
jgi:hypothetical protein